MRIKKLAVMLFTLCLIIAMMPLAVFADDPADRDGDRWGKDLYILGRKIESAYDISQVPHAGTIEYDAANKTLTLNGATLDLSNYYMPPEVENNYAAAICAWDEITIVLIGVNTIKYDGTDALTGKQYVYGIKNSSGDTTIEGTGNDAGSLNINMQSVSGKSFTGIDCKRMLYVRGCDLNVTITGNESVTGMDIFRDFAIEKQGNYDSHVKVTVEGNSSTGVDGTAMFDGSYVATGSSLEMTAQSGTAFYCYMPSDNLSTAKVRTYYGSAWSDDITWTSGSGTYLPEYPYVRYDGNNSGSDRAAKLYLLGRKIDSDGEISKSTVPHKGKMYYENNILTLDGAALDMNDYVPPASNGNLMAAIYSTGKLSIVLKGENKIIFTNEKYANGIEYAYGIESWDEINVSGNGSLDITLGAGADLNPQTSIYGIGCDDEVNVEEATINIDMGSNGKATGMYLWGPANLKEKATVNVTSKGKANYAVNGVNDIAKSTVSADSVLEMTSDNIAFNCWSPGSDLKEAGALINRAATSEGAWKWNPSSSTQIREYKYVKFPYTEPDVVPVPEFTISYDLNGGTLDGKTGVVTQNIASGTVITLPLPTRDGYDFDYWEGSKYYAGDKYTVSEDHTFRAIWKTASAADSGSRDKGKSSGAKTGDEGTIYIWIVLLALSVLGLAGVATGRLRRRNAHK